MKKTVLSATIVSALAATSFTALADGPSFYGRADLAVTDSDMGIATQNQKSGTIIENNFSWLGVKGTEAINSDLEVVYQMEFGVSNFDNSGNTFAARNTFLGLKSATAGTILVGRNDTVFKASEGGFDIFGNTNSDIDLLAAGQSRSADGFSYYSPKIANLVTLNATYLMDDNYDQVNAEGEDVYTDNMYALSATLGDKALKAQNYYVSAAYNDGIDNVKAYRGVAQVKLGQVILGGFYQNSEHVDSKYSNLEGDTYFVNAAYVMGNLKLKAMYGSDDSGLGKYVSRYVGDTNGATLETVSDVDLQQFSLGADYRLSKNTLVYGHYTKYDGDIKLSGTSHDMSDDIFTLGMRFDF